MTAKTRLGAWGHGTRRAGSFASKTEGTSGPGLITLTDALRGGGVLTVSTRAGAVASTARRNRIASTDGPRLEDL